MKLVVSSRFAADSNKIILGRAKLGNRISKTLKLLLENPEHPSLRLHKVSGTNNYSIYVDMSIRIILHIKGEFIYLLRIGSHDDVY